MPVNIPLVQTSDRLINQLQQNIRSAITAPFNDASGTFVGSLTGFSGSAPTGLIGWEAGVDGRMVALSFPSMTGTSNATTMTLSGLPTDLWPKSTQALIVRVTDAGLVAFGTMVISPEGTVTFGTGAGGSAFTASGNKSVRQGTYVYARNV